MNALSLEIIQDEHPSPPWDMTDQYVFFSNITRYQMSMNTKKDLEDFNVNNDLNKTMKAIKKHLGKGWSLFVVYSYIHSGIALSLSNTSYPFTDPWDAGIGGVLAVRTTGGRENFHIRKVAQGYIDELNSYFCGDVWEYVVKDESGNVLDSVGGYYGKKYAEEDGQSSLNILQQHENQLNAEYANQC